MSTSQPPGGPPEGGFAQPQDPWAGGFEPGLASVPTDPIPQQYDPYSAVPPGEVWSQATVLQGGPYGYVPQQPPPKRTGTIVLVTLLVLAVAGGAGYAAYRYTLPTGTGNQTQSPPATSAPGNGATTTSPPAHEPFDPRAAQVGNCIFNFGTEKKPDMGYVDCGKAQSFKIIKISTGEGIPEGPLGTFDTNVTAVAECGATEYQNWYAYDESDDAKDVFYCLTKN